MIALSRTLHSMHRSTKNPMQRERNRTRSFPPSYAARVKSVWGLLLVGTMMLTACGGGTGNSGGSTQPSSVSGNWQFYMDNPVDPSGNTPFVGGLQGGFLLQKSGSLTGQAVYSVAIPPDPNAPNGTPCNTGSAPITGTVNGQTVTLTAVAGSQTFTLTGTLRSDGSAIDNGTYTSTAGTAADGVTPCGIATTQTNWHAVWVPPLTGSVSGIFHSTGSMLANQQFAVTGFLTQGENIGASNATVTGNITFVDPVSLLSDYPCLDTASVNGQISGNTVVLQLFGINGLNVGQIGVAPSQINIGGDGAYPVTYDSTPNGFVLHSIGTGYVVNTKACPNNSSVNNEDIGDICLAVNSTTACQQPITLSPAFLLFPPQLLGSTPTTQTVTVTNNSGSTLTGLSLGWSAESGLGSETGQTSFTGVPNFTEADTTAGDPCAVPLGSTFALNAGQSCTIAVTFAPQESCSWLPNSGGTAPAQCPMNLIAELTVNSPSSVDNDKAFAISITGKGTSALAPSAPELDFGAEAVSEASLPQLLSFTNHAPYPVQILPPAPCTDTVLGQFFVLPHPLMLGSPVGGLQVVSALLQDTSNSTIDYSCDWDLTGSQPNSNFQISSDTCSGTLLEPETSCSLEMSLVPQPLYAQSGGLDYFLELNTVQCVGGAPNCEIDGGRFPVELIANPPSPLRISPASGLNFGTVTEGKSSVQQTITLFNDPNDPNSGTINFIGKIVVTGDYSENDDCPFALAPGGSCTLTVTFTPKTAGRDPGTLTINLTPEPTGSPQIVRLRGSGQVPPPTASLSHGQSGLK